MTAQTLTRLRPQPDFSGRGRSRLRVDASEHVRILVVMATFVGGGYVVYALITVPMMVAQAESTVAAWYPPVGVALGMGPGLMLLGTRFVTAQVRWITVWVLLSQVGVVAAGLVWGVAGIGSSPLPAIWMLDFVGLTAVAACLVCTIPQSLGFLVLGKSVAAYVALAHQDPPEVADMVREAVFGVVFTTLFVCTAVMVVRSGAALDRSRSNAAALVEAHVRNAELARFDGLIHDHVISTLVAAGSDPSDPRVAALAASALDRLDALADDHVYDDEHVSHMETVARLRTVIDPQVDTVVNVPDGSTLRSMSGGVPAAAVRALAEAVGEAVRNSAVHAGPDAERAVVITVDADHVGVAIIDDGVGFDPSAVAVDRLGLALSVRRRLETLPGGRASVRSTPGAGTMIEVSWTRP
ncbi:MULTISPECIES: sensor histidine kinase [Gordonia]|uniref:sensor histidine kinase n=1 Tax=Gordonia TaxID=2053 RepID=UPI0030FEF509